MSLMGFKEDFEKKLKFGVLEVKNDIFLDLEIVLSLDTQTST